MRKMTLASLLAVASVALPLAAHAEQTKGVYLGAGLGAVFPEDSETRVGGVKNRLDQNTGIVGLGNLGYAFGNGLRTEGELSYRYSDIDGVHGLGSGPDSRGSFGVFGFLANALYDFDLSGFGVPSNIKPYVGAGVGGAFVDADRNGRVGGVPGGTFLKGDDVVFAWQAIGGVGVDLTNSWTATVDYRYFATEDATFDTTTAGVNGRADYAAHSVIAGLRYNFGGDDAVSDVTAQPPVTPVVQAPVVPAVPSTYMVFFDFDKAELTPQAKAVLATVAKNIVSGGAAKIKVVGHTDRSGSSKHNAALGAKRAKAVKAELVLHGVKSAEISTRSVGENDTLVPTADGVREAQNRRAVIEVDAPKAPKAAVKKTHKGHKSAPKAGN